MLLSRHSAAAYTYPLDGVALVGHSFELDGWLDVKLDGASTNGHGQTLGDFWCEVAATDTTLVCKRLNGHCLKPCMAKITAFVYNNALSLVPLGQPLSFRLGRGTKRIQTVYTSSLCLYSIPPTEETNQSQC